MQSELQRSIAITQELLAICGPRASSSTAPLELSTRDELLSTIAAAGVPRIEDSRVSPALSTKLHCLTEEYFRTSCLALRSSPAASSAVSLQRLAFSLKSTYMSLYERKLQEAARLRSKPSTRTKQPFANDILAYAFARSQTPTKREREVLASITGMTLEQVRVWFQNRRSRSKKKAPEVQPRPALQLDELLERVKAARQNVESSGQSAAHEEFDDFLDPDYNSPSDRATCALWPAERATVPLSAPALTSRSYPATYSPESLTVSARFDSPTWPRTPSGQCFRHTSTVTMDELARSMDRLSLRHRSRTPRAGTDSELCKNDVLPVISSGARQMTLTMAPVKVPKRKVASKDPETGRKVAGSRRTATAPSAPPPSHPPVAPVAVSSTQPVPCLSPGVPAPKRKTAGPPHRKPATKRALSRQASNGSISSSSSLSTTSSRSTSYASDFSSASSAASDISFTSVESLAPPSDILVPVEQVAQVPVYDFTSMSYPEFGPSAVQFASLVDDPLMQQWLQSTQPQQRQEHSPSPPLPLNVAPADQQALDIGVASMDALMDLSSAAFPELTLEALLADDRGLFTGLSSAGQSEIVWSLGQPVAHS